MKTSSNGASIPMNFDAAVEAFPPEIWRWYDGAHSSAAARALSAPGDDARSMALQRDL